MISFQKEATAKKENANKQNICIIWSICKITVIVAIVWIYPWIGVSVSTSANPKSRVGKRDKDSRRFEGERKIRSNSQTLITMIILPQRIRFDLLVRLYRNKIVVQRKMCSIYKCNLCLAAKKNIYRFLFVCIVWVSWRILKRKRLFHNRVIFFTCQNKKTHCNCGKNDFRWSEQRNQNKKKERRRCVLCAFVALVWRMTWHDEKSPSVWFLFIVTALMRKMKTHFFPSRLTLKASIKTSSSMW